MKEGYPAHTKILYFLLTLSKNRMLVVSRGFLGQGYQFFSQLKFSSQKNDYILTEVVDRVTLVRYSWQRAIKQLSDYSTKGKCLTMTMTFQGKDSLHSVGEDRQLCVILCRRCNCTGMDLLLQTIGPWMSSEDSLIRVQMNFNYGSLRIWANCQGSAAYDKLLPFLAYCI